MKDEIKEILDYLKKEINKFEESKTYLMETYNYREQDIENIEQHKKYVYFKKLLDYITNLQQIEQEHQKINGELREENKKLQEELEDLRESNWAWHQTLKAQNKREYRSKFLKEFQQEYNTKTFPDYDEIYKRYDKLKRENERLIKLKERYQLEKENYKLKNEKAILKIKDLYSYADNEEYVDNYCKDLLNILQGDAPNVKD